MNFIKKNFHCHSLILLVCVSSLLISLSNYQYIYDFEHAGIVFSNSLSLLEGKLPYKEIYILQGFSTLLLNSIILGIFGENLYLIYYLSAAIYSISLGLIYIIIGKLSNYKNAIILLFLIFFIHPNIFLPWGNYYLFFFLLLSVFFFLDNNKTNNILSGVFAVIGVLSKESFLPFYLIFLFLITLIAIYFYSNYEKKKIYNYLIGNIISILVFIFYLFNNKIFFEFIEYYKNRSILFGDLFNYKDRFVSFVLNFFDLKNLYFEPIYPIVLFVFLFCLFSIFKDYYLRTKTKFNIIFIFTLSCLTVSQSVIFKDDIFRYVCGPFLVLICFSHYIKTIQNFGYCIAILLMAYAFSSMSIFDVEYYDKQAKIIRKETGPNNIGYFKKFIWKNEKNRQLKLINNHFSEIKKKCDLTYSFHEGSDHFYSILLNNFFKNLTHFPSYKIDNSYYQISRLQKDLNYKLKKLSFEKDIVVLISNNKNISIIDDLKLLNYFEMPINVRYNNKILKIYYPKECKVYF